MSTLQFPANPAIGDTYDWDAYKYVWDGEKWKTVGIGYNPVNDLKEAITELGGELDPTAEWSAVPAHSDAEIGGPMNAQAEALAARTKLLHTEVMELYRRSYAEAGYNLVAGSFEVGGVLGSPTDVLLREASARAYSSTGPFPQTVPAGTDPTSGGFTDRFGWISSSYTFNSLTTALSEQSLPIGRLITCHGYNGIADGGDAIFEVVSASAPVGILSTSGTYKLKRSSGHDQLSRLLRTGQSPKVIAHRGWSGAIGERPGSLTADEYFVPENTRASIRFAAERGAWGVENDTKITADGVPVVFHDSTTDRVCGVSGTIGGRTLAQVKALDAGSYVSAMYADEKILTHDEWLKECKRCGVVPLVEWSASMSLLQAQDFMASVYKYFGPYPVNVIVQSTQIAALRMLRSLDANICLGFLPGYGSAPTTEQLDDAYALGNCGFMLTGNAILNAGSVTGVKNRNLPLFYAIANNEKRVLEATNAGADALVTDCYLG